LSKTGLSHLSLGTCKSAPPHSYIRSAKYTSPAENRTFLLAAIAFSGAAAVFISYSTAWCVRTCGSTTYSMVGALNKWVFFSVLSTRKNRTRKANRQITSSSIRYPILWRSSQPRKCLCYRSRRCRGSSIRNRKDQPK
jgi:hypothetical protein